MIYRIRTLNVHAEKEEAYRVLIVRAAAYLSEHFPAVKVEIVENVTGPLRQYHMVTRCDSLATLEACEAARKADAGWLAMTEESCQLRGSSDATQQLYRSVS